jgi:hypothetical protein
VVEEDQEVGIISLGNNNNNNNNNAR